MKSNIAGYILAGGKNRRMEGRKKLFLTYQEKSFYEWLREGLSSLDKIYVSVEHTEPYDEVEEELIVDKYEDAGPAGGILSGLLEVPEEALLVVPCDMVPFPANMIEHMLEVYQSQKLPVLVKVRERLAPFPGIYTKAMIPLFTQLIEKHEYKVMEMWKGMTCEYTLLSLDNYHISNVNTKEDYEALKRC